MIDDFPGDLRVARRKSGLSQADCGHLINASTDQVGKIERGIRLPTLRETIALSVLYGRSFESLHGPMMRDIRRQIMARLDTLPDGPRNHPDALRRGRTLETLSHRLLVENQSDHGV